MQWFLLGVVAGVGIAVVVNQESILSTNSMMIQI